MLKSQFIKLIRAAAEPLNIDCTVFGGNWCIELSKNKERKYLVGNTLPLNDAVVFRVVRNKNICSDILQRNGVAHVPHKIFFAPQVLMGRKELIGNHSKIENLEKEFHLPWALKINNTSGGLGVSIVHSDAERESALIDIFAKHSTVCVSPFRNILHEYRCVVLAGENLLTYEKLRPFVIGDGKSSLIELIAQFSKENKGINNVHQELFDKTLVPKLADVPRQGEKVFLQTKHNSSYGTTCQEIEDELASELSIRAARAVNAKFVTVDIIFTEEYGYEVMEINASVLLNLYSMLSDRNFNQSIAVFQKALDYLFAE